MAETGGIMPHLALVTALLFLISSPSAGQQDVTLVEEDRLPADLELSSFDLNLADRHTLVQMTALRADQINDLLKYRSKFGPFLSELELQAVRSLELKDIRALLIRFYIEEQPVRNQVSVSRGYVLGRFKSGGYGMLRAQYRINDIWEGALVMENDAGERWEWDSRNRKYFTDHVAGYVRRTSGATAITAGNFKVHFAQGLLSAAGFSLGKGTNPVESLPGPGSGIRPYRGLQEAGFISGVAMATELGQCKAGIFAGSSHYDATVYGSGPAAYFNAFRTSGHHRTDKEMETRKNIQRSILGGYAEIRTGNSFTTGIMIQADRLNTQLRPTEEWYDVRGFTGKKLVSASVTGRINLNNVFAWTEFAGNSSGRIAWQAGLLVAAGRKWTSSLLMRSYSPGYFAFSARAFGERSLPENEDGIYCGITYRPRKKWILTAGLDIFRFPWLTFNTTSRAIGNEISLTGRFKLGGQSVLFLEYRSENKLVDMNTAAVPVPAIRKSVQTGVYLSGKLNRHLEWRFRIRRKIIRHGTNRTEGTGAFNECILTLQKLKISYRITLFDVSDYSSRIYFYERDVWGSFSLPFYQGKGNSQYLLVRYSLNRSIDIYARTSFTNLLNKPAPGLKEQKKLVSCQVRIKL